MAYAVAWVALMLATRASGDQAPVHAPISDGGKMYIGVDYYPEHWPEERWDTDFRLMAEAGFNVIRVGEFAWAHLEPREGEFDFGWLIRALDGAERHGLRVIIGTPTAVMPAWLAKRYPEALAEKPDGTRTIWGGRRHNSFTDQSYRRLADRIVEEMAKRCGDHPAVVGWQIDNELGGTDCRSANTRAGFQRWLRLKYQTIDDLNRAWGNQFWGLLFAEWDEIPIPDDRTEAWSISNPSASLDWQRYTSDLNVEFLNAHIKLLKAHCPEHHFYTHNLMGLYKKVDYFRLAKQLDVVSWDNYPHLHPTYPYDASMAGALMRGLKGRNYWIMEQTTGPLGWGDFSATPLPGELRKICYQQMAQGCDAQIWFRWRTCTAGREQYWHGLLGHDGEAGRRYEEAAQYARECRRLQSALLGSIVKNEVAVLYDYDSLWALEIQEGYPGASHQDAVRRYYRALHRCGVGVDLVPVDRDLSAYRLVFAPHLHVLPDSVAERLESFVEGGGVLVTDCRTGVKDETNLVHPRTLPGKLSAALGIRIPEYESTSVGMQAPATRKYAVEAGDLGGPYTASLYVDWVEPTSAESVAGYDGESHLAEFSAVTRNALGEGAAWYVGTIVEESAFYDRLVGRVLDESAVAPVLSPPGGIEVAVREGPDQKLLFVINHTNQSKDVSGIPPNSGDLVSGDSVGATLRLEPFGVAVIAIPVEARIAANP